MTRKYRWINIIQKKESKFYLKLRGFDGLFTKVSIYPGICGATVFS